MGRVDEPGPRRRRGWYVPVGRVLGVPVGVSPGLLALAVAGATAAVLAGGPWGRLLLVLAVVGGSLLAHEMAHAVVARLSGYRVDRVTLSLLGGLTAWWGPSPPPHVAVRIAAAGPATSAVLALAFVGLGTLAGGLDGILWVGAAVNLFDALLNLLPLPASDGRTIARALRRPGAAATTSG
ncbi:MAG: site-2 protease family protein [Acidimicrobiales bacterium]|nr:site-2 protease family protein [Acidimicrobiales bacterium]